MKHPKKMALLRTQNICYYRQLLKQIMKWSHSLNTVSKIYFEFVFRKVNVLKMLLKVSNKFSKIFVY